MKQLVAFTKKELMEIVRNGKLLILIIIFSLLGIMNPAIAKLTPWIMKQFSDSLEETGIVVTEVTVDAMASWTQFYKNIPMGLIVFLLLFSGIIANELQKGTLINMITKGMSRKAILIAKTIVTLALWTFNYWLCYGITYGYNAYFWDNSVAKHVGVAAALFYILGVWLIFLMMMMAAFFNTASGVTVGTGAVFFLSYLLSVVPDIKKYLPTKLMDAGGLLAGAGAVKDYSVCLGVVAVLCIIQFVISLVVFDKKQI